MAEFYVMPSVSPTMEMGTIVSWQVAEGDQVAPQTVLAEVGTDKANMDAEIFDNAVVIKLLVEEGAEVPPGFPIAIIGASVDEDISGLMEQFAVKQGELAAGGGAAPAEEPAAPPPAAEPATVPAPAPAPAALEAPDIDRRWMGKTLTRDFMDPPGDLRAGRRPRRIAASPLARAVASDLGVNLARVTGSGPGGRIVRADVEGAQGARSAPAVADTSIRNSPMRKTIARRLTASHQDIPTFFLTAEFDAGGFVAFRKALKARQPDLKVSYNDILIAAVARALRDSPAVNASWGDTHITRYGRVDIGVAVAVDEGLITPVIRGADTKQITDIATEVRELAGRARNGKLAPDEYTGSTFTISNLGMFDIDQFTAIINPPEAAILAVGSIAEVPVVVDGALAVGWRMKVTMTCDHRAIDGATGAQFLQVLRSYVEVPALMLM